MPQRFTIDQAEQRSKHDNAIMIYDFANGPLPADFKFKHISAQLESEMAALHIHSHSQQHFYTSVLIEPEQPFDWSLVPNFCFAFDVQNVNARSTQIFINIFDKHGTMHSRSINVEGNSHKTYLNELKGEYLKGGLNYESGFRSNPAAWDSPFEYATWMWGEMHLDLSAIAKIELSIHGTLIDHQLRLSHFRLILTPANNPDFLKGCIDQYGQSSHFDTAETIHSDAELAAATQAELKALAEGPMADRSQYGGFTGGPRLEATGYFRTEKINGKWSFVDPEGYPYFATGIDILRLANSFTITGVDYDHSTIEQRSSDDVTPEDSKEKLDISPEAFASAQVVNQNRRDFFQWLPDYDEPLAEHYSYMRELFDGPVSSGEIYSFYGANLQRKYGPNYREQWRKVTLDRMQNWGFTSLGNWAAPDYYNNGQVPYFANGWIIGDFKTVSSGDDFWAPLPDPFDPVFKERAEATMAQIKAEIKDSPWCVGIYIDNEKSWGRMGTIQGQHGIAINTLAQDAKTCPTKAEFVRSLQDKYGTIDALNTQWQTHIDSWDSLAAGVSDLSHNPAQLEDYGLLVNVFASEYFRVVKQALQAQLPNHLYCGVRFADWGMTPDVVRAAAKHCDVISYNYYKEGLHPEPWQFLADIDKPSIIGEFHIGVKEGFYHAGLVTAHDQVERGDMYQAYMDSVIDNPYFVGAHWFQYIDSPVSGRSYDGECYNVGFVTCADIPYQPMVNAAKRIHANLYQRRLGLK